MKFQSLAFDTFDGDPKLIFNLTPEDVSRAINIESVKGSRNFKILNQKRSYTKSEQEKIIEKIKDFGKYPQKFYIKLRTSNPKK